MIVIFSFFESITKAFRNRVLSFKLGKLLCSYVAKGGEYYAPSEPKLESSYPNGFIIAANKFFTLTTLIEQPWHGKQDHPSSYGQGVREYVNIRMTNEKPRQNEASVNVFHSIMGWGLLYMRMGCPLELA